MNVGEVVVEEIYLVMGIISKRVKELALILKNLESGLQTAIVD